MFLLGILSILQMAFFPGYILISFFKEVQLRFIPKLVYSFALSILMNYFFVCIATILGFYTSSTVYTVIFIELIYLFFYFKNKFFLSKGITLQIPKFSFLRDFFRLNRIENKIIFISSIIAGLFLLYNFYKNIGTIFNYPDEIGSYNNWALQWIANRMPNPNDTMGYPLAIPANWSLTYLILQNSEIQFFNKIIMSFFPLGVGAILLDRAKFFRDMVPLLALSCFAILLRMYVPYYIGAGPLDLSAACFAFFTFIAAIDAARESISLQKIILVMLLASATATIKQSGLFIVAGVALWLMYLLFAKRKNISRELILKIIIWSSLVTLVFSISWYLWIQYLIYEGKASPESTYLMKGIHGGRNYEERFYRAVHMIFSGGPLYDGKNLAKLIISSLTIFGLLSCFRRSSRVLFIGLILPYFMIWAFFFSYEWRTLALIFPFSAYCAADGFYVLFVKIFASARTMYLPSNQIKYVHLSNRFFGLTLIVVLFLIIGLNFTLFKKEKIVYFQDKLQREIMNSELNHKLYEYHKKTGISGKIASLYGGLKFLPDLKQYYFQLQAPTTIDILNNIVEREDIHYLLILNHSADVGYGYSFTDDLSIQLIHQNLEEGNFHLIFKHNNLSFIKIR